MGRKSKLTDKQWAEIERRLIDGEKPASLAKGFGIDRAAITRRFSQQVRNVKDVAEQIVKTEIALRALPVSQQVHAISLADELRAISTNLAGAAKNGSHLAFRLSSIAVEQIGKVDSTNPMDSQEQLQAISALTKMANESASLGMALMVANKSKDGRMPGIDGAGNGNSEPIDIERIEAALGLPSDY